MNPNLWQYLILLEGLGAIGTAAGLAQEALRRDPLKLVGYANVGVLLICISLVTNIAVSLESRPTLASWIAAVGFGLYFAAASGAWISLSHTVMRRRHRGEALRI